MLSRNTVFTRKVLGVGTLYHERIQKRMVQSEKKVKFNQISQVQQKLDSAQLSWSTNVAPVRTSFAQLVTVEQKLYSLLSTLFSAAIQLLDALWNVMYCIKHKYLANMTYSINGQLCSIQSLHSTVTSVLCLSRHWAVHIPIAHRSWAFVPVLIFTGLFRLPVIYWNKI